MNRKKILFLPVSGPKGSGEYMRSVTLAQAISQTWENVQIQFVLNRHAAYAENSPFDAHMIDRSPTLAVDEVKKIVAHEKPDICIFDSGGRTSLLRMLYQMKIPVVFISSRKRPRKKALSLKWLPFITQHWIMEAEFMAAPLTRWERIKLRLTGSTPPHYFDTLFPVPDGDKRERGRERAGVKEEPYIVFTSGGGGMNQKSGRQAPEIFMGAASLVARQSGMRCIVVMGPNYKGHLPEGGQIHLIPSLPADDFIELIHDAHMVVTGGGSTLIQALAVKKVCVAIPCAGDQPERIKRIRKHGLSETAPMEEEPISQTVLTLINNRDTFRLLQENVNRFDITNGLPKMIRTLSDLLHMDKRFRLEKRNMGVTDSMLDPIPHYENQLDIP